MIIINRLVGRISLRRMGCGSRQAWAAIVLSIAMAFIPGQILAKPITLNLKDADLSAVIATVSEVTGKNFIIDPRVKGKVTIVSSRPMEEEEVYQIFLSILEVHGFAAVQVGSVIKIIPDANAKQSPIPLAGDAEPGEGDEVVTRVVELKNVSASQLVPILRPLLPQQGHLAAYVPSNILIFADRSSNIERILKIIDRIDIPSGDEIEIIALQHAAAPEVVRLLTTLDQQAHTKAGGGPAGAEDSPILIADERTNSILIGGGKSGRLRMRAIISHLDTPLATEGNTRVIYLRYAQAKDLVPVLTGVSASVEQQAKGAAAGTPSARVPVNIQAEENTNALVITAPPDLIRSLETVIKQLDVRRAQVQVETIIAEVSENLAAALGVQWIADGTPGGEGPVGVSNFSGSGASISSIGSAIALGGVPALPNGLTLGIGRFNDDKTNFAAIITALKGDGTTNILSTPTLVTMDNEEAEIVVGQEVPFITGSFTSTGTSSTPTNPFQTIQRQNVGITLKIKPQINEGDAVRLDINQSVDSVAAGVAGAADLITNKRSIKTSVIVDDGRTVVLGGLIEDQASETVQKVPLLGDIPLLGLLFKSKSTDKRKQNLMVFMRPTIIRDAAVTTRLTSSKYSYIRTQQMAARKKGLLLMRDEESPVLPELDEFLVEPPPFKEVPFTPADKADEKEPVKMDTTPQTVGPKMDEGDDAAITTPPSAPVNQSEEIDSAPPQVNGISNH